MKIVGMSDIGLARAENQDNFSYKVFSDVDAFALVCDGMGGTSGGSQASQIATQLITERVLASYRPDITGVSAENVLESAVAAANIEIFDTAVHDPSLKGMGTTVVAAIILDKTVHIAHVGDSRAYVYHDGELEQITLDHSYVQDMVDKGKITPEQARMDPRKHIITRALGVDDSIQVDFDTLLLSSPGDMLLLCSDGLTNMVEPNAIKQFIETTDFEQLPQVLINAANENGGLDNITVVAVLQ